MFCHGDILTHREYSYWKLHEKVCVEILHENIDDTTAGVPLLLSVKLGKLGAAKYIEAISLKTDNCQRKKQACVDVS